MNPISAITTHVPSNNTPSMIEMYTPVVTKSVVTNPVTPVISTSAIKIIPYNNSVKPVKPGISVNPVIVNSAIRKNVIRNKASWGPVKTPNRLKGPVPVRGGQRTIKRNTRTKKRKSRHLLCKNLK